MIRRKVAWYESAAFVRGAQLLGIIEMLGGLALLVFRNDGAQGFALLAVGAGTFGGMAAVKSRRSS